MKLCPRAGTSTNTYCNIITVTLYNMDFIAVYIKHWNMYK